MVVPGNVSAITTFFRRTSRVRPKALVVDPELMAESGR
jgi:hypothetical protein